MSATKLALPDLAATTDFAAWLAPALRVGDTLLLSGDLGAGKTSFAQALIRTLAPNVGEVTSPTFTLVQTYPVTLQGSVVELYHYDLYRLDTPHALRELGLEESDGNLRLIEWPEHAGDALDPASWLHVQFSLVGEGRQVQWRAGGALAERLERIAA